MPRAENNPSWGVQAVMNRGRLWNAFYRGWFAARSDRPRPQVDSMVEYSYVVDGYTAGLGSEGKSLAPQAASSEVSAGDSGEAPYETPPGADKAVANEDAVSDIADSDESVAAPQDDVASAKG